MSVSPTDIRVVTYQPLGAQGPVLPVSSIQFGSTGAGGTLSVQVSDVVYQTLPTAMELAVQVYGPGGWAEPRDARFIVEKYDDDDRDLTGTYTLTGQPIVLWMMQRAVLNGVEPYRLDGVPVIGIQNYTVSATDNSSAATFTLANHGIKFGDRLRVTDKGKAKNISDSGIYWARGVTTNTFELGVSRGGSTRKKVGGSGITVKLERFRDLVVATDNSFVANERVSVRKSDGSNLSDGTVYYVARKQDDAIGFSTSAGGTAIELATDTMTVFRYLDGQRLFKSPSNSSGYILGVPMSEAQDRGTMSGISRDFTGGHDSNNVGWLNFVSDEDGVPVGFNPGSTLVDMQQYLLNQGVCEFATQGRTWRVFNPNTGSDYSTGSAPMRIGAAATEAPMTLDLSNLTNAITVRGEGPILEQVDGSSTGPFGRLESYVTVSGVQTISMAQKLGHQAVLAGASAMQQYQVTEPALAAQWKPAIDFQRGDYVQVQLNNQWTAFRVAEWMWAKASDGSVTVTSVLGQTITGVVNRLVRKVHSTAGGLSSAGTIGTLTEADNRKAAPPVITVTSAGKWNAGGLATSQIDVSWTPVTVDEDGLTISAAEYEVWVREDGQEIGSSVAITAASDSTVGPYRVGQLLAVSVRAISMSGTYGVFSDEVDIITLGPLDIPLTPTPPVLETKLGGVNIVWDGLCLDGGATVPPDLGFAYVSVERSDSQFGVYSPVGSSLLGAGLDSDAGLVVGNTYWYRLTAYNAVNTPSIPSTSVSIVVLGVDFDSLGIDVQGEMNSASGKNKIIRSPAAATGTDDGHGYTFVDGDLWWQYGGTSNQLVVGQWSYLTGVWVAQAIDGLIMANIDAGKITVGIINAAVIGANSITTDKLDAGAINGMTITGSTIQTSSGTGARVVINGSGISGFNSANTLQTSINASTGAFMSNDATVRGTIYAIAGEIIGNLTMTTGQILISSGGAVIAGAVGGANAQIRSGVVLVQSSPGNQIYLNNSSLTIADTGVGSVSMTSSAITYTGALTISAASASFVLTNDGSPLAQSMSIYNRTYSTGVSTVVITTFGTLGRLTSALKYKQDVQRDPITKDPFAILKLSTSSWRDIAAVKRAEADGRDWSKWSREWGVIAEEAHDAGLRHLVEYDGKGTRRNNIEGFSYSMVGTALLAPVAAMRTEQLADRKRIVALERAVAKLTHP